MRKLPSQFLDSRSGSDLANFLEIPSGFGTLNIVCVGAHPDDAESGCGGTLAKLAALGHNVTILCLTRGEAGIRDSEHHAAAVIRTAEAERASKMLGVRIAFGNQIDGQTATDLQQSLEFGKLLASLSPDIVFTHWPLDTHRDHRAAAVLAYEAWQRSEESFALVYYEVMAGIQTHHFEPNCYVDVGATFARKQSSIYAHESQGPGRFYPYHEEMEKRRGEQAEVDRAEAFFVVRKKVPQPYFAVAV
jgi:LmbE family N-acetylglucosaminyl deacetylase